MRPKAGALPPALVRRGGGDTSDQAASGLFRAADQARGWKPADAALAVIASELGVLRTGRATPTDELLSETRTARPLVELAVQHIGDNIEAFTEGR